MLYFKMHQDLELEKESWWTHLVAPVQITFPEDQIVAVILGFLSFIKTF